MKILLDAMGGDNAPKSTVQGAADAVKEFGDGMTLALLGDEAKIKAAAQELGVDLTPFELIHCTEDVDMHDDPVKAVRHKKDSSLVKGLTMLKNGVLAKVLGYQFIDADLVIQEQEKRLLREIIAEEGTEGFIQVENRVNATLEAHHAIIATGGSVVYGKEAMEHLQEIGTVIYLEVAYPELEKRLEDIKGRGVVLRDGQTLYDLYLERTPLYEKYADIRISETGLDIEQTVEQIVDGITNLH